MLEPTLPKLIIAKSRISATSWECRVEAAERDEGVLRSIKTLVDGGMPLNKALSQVVPASKRSWVVRRWKPYQHHGLEALVDARAARAPKFPATVREAIRAARRAKPTITVDEVVELLAAQRVKAIPAPATIKREFTKVDRQNRYRKEKARAAAEVTELTLAGGELLLAAEIETGAIAALAAEVSAIAGEAIAASQGREPVPDVERRSRNGHFTASYNRHRRRRNGEDVASYLRSAAEKAADKVPTWARFVHEQPATIAAKLQTIVFEPAVNRTQGWDGLRSTEAAELGPLLGSAYSPSTLQKFVSQLAVAGAGPRMLEAMGKRWHEVATERWKEDGAMAALYVDNHAKEVWSSLFTQSGKVSSLSRVMPAITTTYVHTGAGTPLVMGLASGGAPLAPRLVSLVERAEKALGDEIARAVVIDSEGSTFDILESFSKAGRVIVTPLRPSRAPSLELRFGAGSFFRPYREHDELRVGAATLEHRSSGRSLEIGALVIRRAHRESDTVLLTTGLGLGLGGRELADLYFARWPIQENWFKDAGAVGLDDHRGNCSRMVANVAVVTKVERLRKRIAADVPRLAELETEQRRIEQAASGAGEAHRRAASRLVVRRQRLDELAAKPTTKAFARAAAEHHLALLEAERARVSYDVELAALEKTKTQAAELRLALAKTTEALKAAEPQQRIRELDVAQDSILTATKLMAAQLIRFASREYLRSLPMTQQTFLARVLTIRGRRERRPGEERVVFYENRRDPAITSALRDACERLNARKLERDGRRLRYAVEAEDSHACE